VQVFIKIVGRGEGEARRWSRRKETALDLSSILPPSHPSFLPTLGAAIITATAIQDFYAILGAFGIGFDVANIVGVMVTTHVAANQVRQ